MSTMTKRRRWSLLVTVGAGLLLITLDNSILYTALPTRLRSIPCGHCALKGKANNAGFRAF